MRGPLVRTVEHGAAAQRLDQRAGRPPGGGEDGDDDECGQ
jgi:hypothetical protein